MTELFCKIANRTRVLLYILLGASLAYAVFDIIGILDAYNALEGQTFPVWPLVRAVLGRPAVYALILIGVRLGAEKTATRFILSAAFGFRALAVLSETTERGAGMVPLLRDITCVVAAVGACILLGSNRRSENLRLLISFLSMAAMVSALTVAYVAVVGMLDGEIHIIRGILMVPDSLIGIVLALFFGDIRQREAEEDS